MAKQKDEITKKGGILLHLVAEGYKKKKEKKSESFDFVAVFAHYQEY